MRGGVGGRIRRWLGAMGQRSFVPSTGDAWVALEAVLGRTGGRSSRGWPHGLKRGTVARAGAQRLLAGTEEGRGIAV